MPLYLRYFMCFILVSVAGCSSTPPPQPLPYTNTEKKEINTLYQNWVGVPYQFGGQNRAGIDCSAFMQVTVMSLYQLELPRTTEQQSKRGRYIPENQAAFGDLIFFKTGWNQRHVGFYLGNKQFMHASSSKGVMISRTDNPYWASAFWQFRRITPVVKG
ncbi:hydrolase [Vibrio sp. S17_S38]|uniref:C40 family peptidase n=1 Tax=Vibrio sp. S17_S38 TaxID=2720229 RepID=UPI001680D266|nr:NlpC/P60 family protein [Vibrio sp. S17_S38]MBD1572860.1 hydrolase [Vibrio sp. S17_S38]